MPETVTGSRGLISCINFGGVFLAGSAVLGGINGGPINGTGTAASSNTFVCGSLQNLAGDTNNILCMGQAPPTREQQRLWKRERKTRHQAEKKAKKLLRTLIGERRYAGFRQKKHLEVTGASGRRYRLRFAARIEVMRLDEPEEIEHELCVHYDGKFPSFDSLIVQYLMLTASAESEEQLVKIANLYNQRLRPMTGNLGIEARVA